MAQTALYYHVAYTWAALLYALYLVSLWRRRLAMRDRLTRLAASDARPSARGEG